MDWNLADWNLAGWTLASPWALLLLPLPFLAARFLPPVTGSSGALFVPLAIASRLEGKAPRGIGKGHRWLLPAALWVALVVAIAGPRLILPQSVHSASDREIYLALDLSGSMEIEDFELDGQQVQRLAAVKKVATDFVLGRGGDRIGLIVFADKAFFAAPPTYDVRAVADAVEEATIGISGRSTAISDGLGLALKRMEQSDVPSKVVILLSDGRNTAGNVEPREAAKLARELGVRVHTIAMGIHDTATSDDRNAVDADTLRDVADLSGGTFFRVRTTADLEAVARSIDALEANRVDRPTVQVYRDFWVWPAGLAFLLALSLLLFDRRAAA